MKLLKEYIRQIISEGTLRAHGLGALVVDHSSGKKGVIYDVERLKGLARVLSKSPPSASIRIVSQEAIRGYIVVGPPRGQGPCRGAWVTVYSAGPDYGKEVYALGHALTPDGRLMPDRFYVSDDANDGWLKQAHRPRQALDDISAHNPDGTAKHDHPNHTDDRSDDCKVYWRPEDEHLNYVYEPTGEEGQFRNTLTKTHQETLNQLAQFVPSDNMEHILSEAGDDFFDANF